MALGISVKEELALMTTVNQVTGGLKEAKSLRDKGRSGICLGSWSLSF